MWRGPGALARTYLLLSPTTPRKSRLVSPDGSPIVGVVVALRCKLGEPTSTTRESDISCSVRVFSVVEKAGTHDGDTHLLRGGFITAPQGTIFLSLLTCRDPLPRSGTFLMDLREKHVKVPPCIALSQLARLTDAEKEPLVSKKRPNHARGRRRHSPVPRRRSLLDCRLTVAGGAATITSALRAWGCSSAGRALPSQGRGRGFESLHLHQRPFGPDASAGTRAFLLMSRGP